MSHTESKTVVLWHRNVWRLPSACAILVEGGLRHEDTQISLVPILYMYVHALRARRLETRHAVSAEA